MNQHGISILAMMVVTGVSGCATPTNMPLVFGQSHTVGISISGSATDQGAELTVGYKDRDIAVVPVTVQASAADNGQLEATAGGDKDAFSVLGQFNVNAQSAQPQAGLGKFFATGVAARRLADGFACNMGDCQAPESGAKAAQPGPAATP